MICFDESAQEFAFGEQMLLPDDLSKVARTHPFGQRLVPVLLIILIEKVVHEIPLSLS